MIKEAKWFPELRHTSLALLKVNTYRVDFYVLGFIREKCTHAHPSHCLFTESTVCASQSGVQKQGGAMPELNGLI